MKVITVILSLGLILLNNSDTLAQDRKNKSDDTRITLHEIRNDIRAHLTNGVIKQKSGIDQGLSEMQYDQFISDWIHTETDVYEYSNDRSMISIDHYNIYNQEQTFQYSYSTEIMLDDNGNVLTIYSEFIPEVYSTYQFFYNENGRIDSLFVEDYEEGFSFKTEIRFFEITSDSLRFEVRYIDDGELEESDVNYVVVRDGNYTEYYVYPDWIDRYTYYDFNMTDIGALFFDNSFLIEEYNDEFYEGQGWVPYSRSYFVEEEGVRSQLVSEYFDSGEWFSDTTIDIAYDSEGRINELTDYFIRGDEIFYNERYRFIYEQSTSINDFENFNPDKITLHQNYPNPFNPSTNIIFELSTASNIELKVFNVLGKEVATLVDGRKAAGSHSINFDAKYLPSGLYVYRLITDEFSLGKSMMLIK